MSTKHTPGPWKAEGWENTVINSADGYTITCGPGGSPDTTLEEMQANAQLIAAAPSLLDACEVALASIIEHGGNRWPTACTLRNAIERAGSLAIVEN